MPSYDSRPPLRQTFGNATSDRDKQAALEDQ